MGLGAACDWVIRAAIRIRNPHEALGDLTVMLERMFPMQLVHWVMVSYISLVLGKGKIWVVEGGLLDFILLPV